MDRLLNEVVERLQKAHGSTLVSVVLYGSAASPETRDRFSDLNILCVLKQVAVEELREAEPVFRWWREMGNPAPLLLSVEEVRTSADSFALEFHDILERHVILFGEDVIAGLAVDDSFYRARVEYELRAKLLRLRQKAGGLLSERDLLLRLMADSVSTFCVLFRHALRMAGEQPKFGKREIVAAAHERFGIRTQPFDTLLDLREEKIRPRSVSDPAELLRACLNEIGAVIEAVDRIAK